MSAVDRRWATRFAALLLLSYLLTALLGVWIVRGRLTWEMRQSVDAMAQYEALGDRVATDRLIASVPYNVARIEGTTPPDDVDELLWLQRAAKVRDSDRIIVADSRFGVFVNETMKLLALPWLALAILPVLLRGRAHSAEPTSDTIRETTQLPPDDNDDLLRGMQQVAAGNFELALLPLAPDDPVAKQADAMRTAFKKRLDEQSLQLEVSRHLEQNLSLEQSVRFVLQVIRRVTGVNGVRAVIYGPQGGQPLRFGEGALADMMAPYDRPVLALVRHADSLLLATRSEMRGRLNVPPNRRLSFEALQSFALREQDELRGAVWLGFEQERPQLSAEQRRMVQNLCGRLTQAIANARLSSVIGQRQRQLSAVLHSVSEPLVCIDRGNRFLFANPAFAETFGLQDANVRGRLVADLVRRPDLRRLLLASTGQAGMAELVSGDAAATHVPKATSQATLYEPSVSPVIDAEGVVYGRVIVFKDVTLLKQRDLLKNELVENVSHDLRNPLMSMHTYASLLGEVGDLNETQGEYVSQIVGNITRMNAMIREILDIGRIESGVDLNVAELSAELLLKQVAQTHEPIATAQENELVVTVDPSRLRVYADQSLLRQALDNLVVNALNYAPASGPIILGAQSHNGQVLFSVSDKGDGIDAADLPYIFDKFYRGSTSKALGVTGSGIGLAMVKTVAEHHGGHAWVESEAGRGTTIFMSLPRRE